LRLRVAGLEMAGIVRGVVAIRTHGRAEGGGGVPAQARRPPSVACHCDTTAMQVAVTPRHLPKQNVASRMDTGVCLLRPPTGAPRGHHMRADRPAPHHGCLHQRCSYVALVRRAGVRRQDPASAVRSVQHRCRASPCMALLVRGCHAESVHVCLWCL
jgi:hypothetical protein